MPKLRPTNYSKFHCIMQDCENHCCKEWQIFFDKNSYKRYEKSNLIYDGSHKKRIIRNADKKSNFDYAMAVLDENHICSFLEDGLCMIHKQFGSEALSITCDTYPRKMNDFTTHIEESLSISCPEAARVLLLDRDPMEFVFVDEEFRGKYPPKYKLHPFDEYDNEQPIKYLWDLRSYTIELLQKREYSLNQRLMLLGVFCRKLQKKIQSEDYDLYQCMDEMDNLLSNETMVGEVFSHTEFMKFKLSENFVESFIRDLVVDHKLQNTNYKSMLNRIVETLEIGTDEYRFDEVLKRYDTLYERIFLPFVSSKSHIIENLLVYEVYSRLFPFYDTEQSISESFNRLMLIYYLLQFCLTSGGFKAQEIDDNVAIEIIHSVYRQIEHTSNIMDIFKKA